MYVLQNNNQQSKSNKHSWRISKKTKNLQKQKHTLQCDGKDCVEEELVDED